MTQFGRLLRNLCLVVSLTLFLSVHAMGGIMEGGIADPPPPPTDTPPTAQSSEPDSSGAAQASALGATAAGGLTGTEQLLVLANALLSAAGI